MKRIAEVFSVTFPWVCGAVFVLLALRLHTLHTPAFACKYMLLCTGVILIGLGWVCTLLRRD